MAPARLIGTTRAQATLLLLAFVWALLAGAFLHPLGEVAHACDATAGHVDTDPEHTHDQAHCGLCHLTRELAHTTAPAPPPAAQGPTPRAILPRAPRAAPPGLALRSTFRSRAPPARG